MKPDRRKTSIEWPLAVDDRLRLLVNLAQDSGMADTTSASELLAALVCAQPLDGNRIARAVLRHRERSLDDIARTNAQHGIISAPRRGRPRGRTNPSAAGEQHDA